MNTAKGMSVDEVRRMARDLADAAEEIEQMRTELTTGLEEVDWTGPDADRFRGEWADEMDPALEDLSTAISALSTTAETNAQEQESTSA